MHHMKRTKIKRGLTFKLIILIFSSVAIIFTLIFLDNYHISKKMVEKNLKLNAELITKNIVYKAEKILGSVQEIPNNFSKIIEDSSYSEAEINRILRLEVENNSEIFGASIAYEPFYSDSTKKYYAPYYYRNKNEIKFKYLGNEQYDYFTMDWYKIAKELNRPTWSEPYYDKGGGDVIMSTYSVPLYREKKGEKHFIGILTADVSLDLLRDYFDSIKVFKSGYAFMISKNGTYISHPIKELIINETIFSIAKAQKSSEMSVIGRKMIKGESIFAETEFYNIRYNKLSRIAYAPVSLNGWSVGVVFPVDEFMADVNNLFIRIMFLGLGGLFIICLVIIFISRSITSPLRKLSIATDKFAEGDFSFIIPPVSSNDEVGSLNKSFVRMRSALKTYIENLKLTTSAKEKIESELKIAREIQMGMIPRKFPAFPDRNEFDIYGFIEPAKEVGGDLYDFFFIDDERLCFAIGDVSGKGTPAALFMAITTTIMRAETQIAGLNTSRVIDLMNNYLCKNNEGNLFVTLFLGILNTSTGEVEYINAGHNYPFVIKSSGNVSELNTTHCIPLGISVNSCRNPNTFKLEKGDTIFLYTDGVSEAFNINNQQYSIKRISEILGNQEHHTPFEIIHHIVGDVKAFSQGTEQSDDISLLAIQYSGKQLLKTSAQNYQLVIKNSIGNLSSISEMITRLGINWKLSSEVCKKVNLVIEELISNTIFYGYSDTLEHDIILNLMCDENTLSIEIIDDAKEFNPVAQESADTNSDINEREIGGLGIHLVKNLTDAFTYQRKDIKNIIKIEIHF
jgi:sigma-B regulation protein RsbU (phosphoserine phosphatase)